MRSRSFNSRALRSVLKTLAAAAVKFWRMDDLEAEYRSCAARDRDWVRVESGVKAESLVLASAILKEADLVFGRAAMATSVSYLGS